MWKSGELRTGRSAKNPFNPGDGMKESLPAAARLESPDRDAVWTPALPFKGRVGPPGVKPDIGRGESDVRGPLNRGGGVPLKKRLRGEKNCDKITLTFGDNRRAAPEYSFFGGSHERVRTDTFYFAGAKGFFGPTGTLPELRDQGIQCALFYACAMDMWRAGYGYLIIGGGNTGAEAGFYERIAGAEPIKNSIPGIYAHRI